MATTEKAQVTEHGMGSPGLTGGSNLLGAHRWHNLIAVHRLYQNAGSMRLHPPSEDFFFFVVVFFVKY